MGQVSGVPGYAAQAWFGVFAPSGTPSPAVERLNQGIGRALTEQGVKARFDALGNEVSGLGPAEFGACVRAEVSRWAEIVRHYVRSSGLAMCTRSKPFSLTRPVS